MKALPLSTNPTRIGLQKHYFCMQRHSFCVWMHSFRRWKLSKGKETEKVLKYFLIFGFR